MTRPRPRPESRRPASSPTAAEHPSAVSRTRGNARTVRLRACGGCPGGSPPEPYPAIHDPIVQPQVRQQRGLLQAGQSRAVVVGPGRDAPPVRAPRPSASPGARRESSARRPHAGRGPVARRRLPSAGGSRLAATARRSGRSPAARPCPRPKAHRIAGEIGAHHGRRHRQDRRSRGTRENRPDPNVPRSPRLRITSAEHPHGRHASLIGVTGPSRRAA